MDRVRDISEEKAYALIGLEKTRDSLEQLHRQCADNSSKRRKASIDSHNRKTGIRQINFGVGDYVLKGLLQRKSAQRLL